MAVEDGGRGGLARLASGRMGRALPCELLLGFLAVFLVPAVIPVQAAERPRLSPDEIRARVRDMLKDSRYQQTLPDGAGLEPEPIMRRPRLRRQVELERPEAQTAGTLARAIPWLLMTAVVVTFLHWTLREALLMRQRAARIVGDGHTTASDRRAEDRRALLARVEELAADQAYAEAAHLLLCHAIQNLAGQETITAAMTSREILSRTSLRQAARQALATLVVSVENSFFGGRRLDHDGYLSCRSAFDLVTGNQAAR